MDTPGIDPGTSRIIDKLLSGCDNHIHHVPLIHAIKDAIMICDIPDTTGDNLSN